MNSLGLCPFTQSEPHPHPIPLKHTHTHSGLPKSEHSTTRLSICSEGHGLSLCSGQCCGLGVSLQSWLPGLGLGLDLDKGSTQAIS